MVSAQLSFTETPPEIGGVQEKSKHSKQIVNKIRKKKRFVSFFPPF